MSISSNYILYGGDFNINLSKQISYGEYVLRKAYTGGNKTCLIDGILEKSWTCNDFVINSLKNYHILKKLGIQYGDVIAICSENRLEYLALITAGFLIGATVTLFNPTYTKDEMLHCLNICKPKTIFCSYFTYNSIIEAQENCLYLKNIISFDELPAQKNILDYNFLCESIKNESTVLEKFHFPKFNSKDTVALVLYSSGTTGLPKGVMLTHYNLLYNQEIHTEWNSIVPDDVCVSFLPMFHAYGCIVSFFAVTEPITLIIMIRFEPELYFHLIEKYRATFCVVVPPICVLLAKSPLINKYDLTSIQYIMCGAAPLSKTLSQAVSNRLKIPPVRQGYGMTETTLSITKWPRTNLLDKHFQKHGSVGKLVPGIYAKVVDLKSGELLPPFKEGELCFKGDLIMKGYYGNSKSDTIIDPEGWLHTGDIGYYDDELYFYIVDRSKELIKVKGFQVAPAEIESVLLQNELVKDAGVIGIPDEENGEIPFAFVVKQPNANLTELDVQQFIKGRLSSFKHLKGGVCFVEEIPKNPSGKILRRKLREIFSAKTKSKL